MSRKRSHRSASEKTTPTGDSSQLPNEPVPAKQSGSGTSKHSLSAMKSTDKALATVAVEITTPSKTSYKNPSKKQKRSNASTAEVTLATAPKESQGNPKLEVNPAAEATPKPGKGSLDHLLLQMERLDDLEYGQTSLGRVDRDLKVRKGELAHRIFEKAERVGCI